MEIQDATPQELMDELRKRGFDPTALALADMNELAVELKGRGQAFVSAIYVIDEDTMMAHEAGKIGVIHHGDPLLQMKLACRVFHETGTELVHDRQLTLRRMKEIVSFELGDMFEFDDPDEDDEDLEDE